MSYKLITFDVYSALLDIKGSLVPVLEQAFPKAEADMVSVFTTWRTRQWDYVLLSNCMEKGFLSYEYITRCALDYTLSKFGLSCSEEDKKQLVGAWSRLHAWPESSAVLAEVKKRGYMVGILSNGDQGMLKALESTTGIIFDHIFSADQAGYYKPSPKIYELPFAKLGLSRQQVLHVAGSPFDMMGAKAAGMHCAWSNRFRDSTIDSRYQPDFEWDSLEGLLEII